MKLIVQIPCLNEAETLPATVRDIPRTIPGIDTVEILVIDDGSTDRTVAVARELGVEHVVSFKRNRGLGYAMMAGFEEALRLGADIIVNTDGDNQYAGGDIPKLLAPILAGRAEMVIGDRQTDAIAHFSPAKRRLQRLGSRVISRLAHVAVPDVASGFRAYTRFAAMHLNSHGSFDHTVEHTIQAGHNRWAVEVVPIGTNPKARESRLFDNIGEFVVRSGLISLRTYAKYRALTMFSAAGAISFAAGVVLGLRFVWIYLFGQTSELHVQSLILAAILLLAGFQMVLTGVVADLIGTNRALLEDMAARVKEMEMRAREGGDAKPSGRPPGGDRP
ncbi:MAG: glycosyltransferase family 2 protein [Caldilineae bacterium]|nr:glycosyltransferase family 2 protein [Caldilineae bacterium]